MTAFIDELIEPHSLFLKRMDESSGIDSLVSGDSIQSIYLQLFNDVWVDRAAVFVDSPQHGQEFGTAFRTVSDLSLIAQKGGIRGYAGFGRVRRMSLPPDCFTFRDYLLEPCSIFAGCMLCEGGVQDRLR
ncbi:hypothetical protein ATM97_23710 [Nocardia sp. MH4]|nr:hypothetical protein [Nocardia sp. MH4]